MAELTMRGHRVSARAVEHDGRPALQFDGDGLPVLIVDPSPELMEQIARALMDLAGLRARAALVRNGEAVPGTRDGLLLEGEGRGR